MTFLEVLNSNKTKVEYELSVDNNYDTRKVNNRSNVKITEDAIQEIELQGVTLERLEELKVPIFKYQTQLTLHGIFSDVSTTRIAGYKNLIVNQNQSLGVRYTAIDVPKKKIIRNALNIYEQSIIDKLGLKKEFSNYSEYVSMNVENKSKLQTEGKSVFRVNTDSRGTVIYMEKKVTKENAESEYEKMKVTYDKIPDNFVGKKTFGLYKHGGYPFGVSYYVAITIDFKAIRLENLFPFIAALTDGYITNEDEYEDKKYDYNEQKRKEKEQSDAMWQRSSDEREAKENEIQRVIDNKIAELARTLNYPIYKGDLPKTDFVLTVLTRESRYNENIGFLTHYVSKGSFNRILCKTEFHKEFNDIQPTPSKTNYEKSKVFDDSIKKQLLKYIQAGRAYLISPRQIIKAELPTTVYRPIETEIKKTQQTNINSNHNTSTTNESMQIKTFSTNEGSVTVVGKHSTVSSPEKYLRIEVKGDTKPHKEFLKSHRVKIWDSDKKMWWTDYATVADYEAVINYFENISGGSSDLVESPTITKQAQPKPSIDARVKLAEQWQKVADSTQKKSDDLSSKLANKATHTRRMMEQYMHAKTTQEKWSDVANAAQVVATGLANKTIDGDILELIKKLKPMVGSEPYENPVYPFCEYRYYNGYGGRNDKYQWNYQNRKPDGFMIEECALLTDFIQGKSTREPENPNKAELDRLIREIKFSSIEGFFPTPPNIIQKMIDLADINYTHTILEPSAGIGSIVDALKAINKHYDITCVEQNYTLARILELKGYPVIRMDFLDFTYKKYDRILMNPPFENGQDAQHIELAYSLLRPGGKLVAIAGEGIFFRNDKKAVAFRDFLEKHNGYSEKLPQDAFNGKDAFRKTGVATRIVVLEKEMLESVRQNKTMVVDEKRLMQGIKSFNQECLGLQRQGVLYENMVMVLDELIKCCPANLLMFIENDGLMSMERVLLNGGLKPDNLSAFAFMMISEIKSRFNIYGYTYFEAKYHLNKLELV